MTKSVKVSQAQPSQSLLKSGLEQRYRLGVSLESCLARTALRTGIVVPTSVNRGVVNFMVCDRFGSHEIDYIKKLSEG